MKLGKRERKKRNTRKEEEEGKKVSWLNRWKIFKAIQKQECEGISVRARISSQEQNEEKMPGTSEKIILK